MTRLCLNGIVKNESGRIERMLDSVTPFIDCAVIVDTGSTDNTKELISDYFRYHKVPCILGTAPFINWSQARNEALKLARWARQNNKLEFDYCLLCDADMQLIVRDRSCFDGLTGDSYDMYQQAGTLHYQNRRLVRWDTTGEYVGVTHEYLGVDSYGCIPDTQAVFYDHADGANRPKKFKRDIQLLLQGLKDEPGNARYMFYLAQSYRDAGGRKNLQEAAKWYRKRIEAGGWDEEVFQAELCHAHTMLGLKRESDFISGCLRAYNSRPTRAEPLYDLANWYRHKGMNAAALAIAEAGLHLPLSKDALFVNDFVYKAGLKEEVSICAFYVPGKRQRGFEVTDRLSLQAGPYAHSRELARNNLYHYLPKLSLLCPSFETKTLWHSPDPLWVAMNPSVTNHMGALRAVVRTVNYRMDEQGRYLINGTDGTANNSNPINTRNYLACLDDALNVTEISEILPPGNKPEPAFLPVIGFEDMRLFSWLGSLWTSSTVREMNAQGVCEQVLARIGDDMQLQGDWKRMMKLPIQYEKNWGPIVSDEDLMFMYRQGEVIDINGNTLFNNPTGLDTGHVSGGSQVIPFMNGWISITHEARYLPNTYMRYYVHRFFHYDGDFSVDMISPPFCFDDKVIEFAAGMCFHPGWDKFVISYGYKDAEAKIATIDVIDIINLLGKGWKRDQS